MSASSFPVSRGDPYQNPELFRWTGSMEGVPDWVESTAPAAQGLLPGPWREVARGFLDEAARLLPGLGMAFALAFLGQTVAARIGAALFGAANSPISPIGMAILFGLAIRNTIGLPTAYDAGLVFALKRVLRIGVALLGIRLSLAELARTGLFALPIVIGCIATALLCAPWISRALRVPRALAALVAVGTAICGNSAIVATAPVIGAKQGETSYAVGCVTLFGLIALLAYPWLAHTLFAGDPRLGGLFLGTAIHDTAQVAGAGLLYAQQYGDPAVLATATVTKLVRNVFMIAVIPLMAVAFRDPESASSARKARIDLSTVIPWFVVGFVVMALVRTLGDVGPLAATGESARASWLAAIEGVSAISAWCLATAMASVGLGTDLGRLRALGLRPLAVGFAAALSVGAVSAVLIYAMRALGCI